MVVNDINKTLKSSKKQLVLTGKRIC